MLDCSKDDILYWLMTDRSERLKLKAMLKLDADKDHMNLWGLQKQLFFNSQAWITACKKYQRYYGEPDDLIKTKFAAITSLSENLKDSYCPSPKDDATQFTWSDFKRGYQIMQIWQESRRLEQTKWENFMDNEREEKALKLEEVKQEQE